MLKNKTLITILICCSVSVFWSCASSGSTAKTLFFQAEACHRELQNSANNQKYRSYWFSCIGKFEAVYQQDPSGIWAAAALFNMASLYEALYSHSYKPEDRQEAEKLYRQIIADFPASAYRQRAQAAVKNMPQTHHGAADIESVKKDFFAAEASYTELLSHPDRQKFRSYWMEPIQKFEAVYAKDPSGAWAAAALYNAASLYEKLYAHSFKAEDKQKSEEIFEKIINHFPNSAYCEKAENRLQKDIKSLILDNSPEKAAPVVVGKTQDCEKEPLPKAANGDFSKVTDIRYWSNPEYTRVVIDADQATSFQNNLLNKDPAIDKSHQRLYIDLKNSRLDCAKKTIPINNSLLKAVRAGQYTSDTVRVVIDINSFEDYNIFSLPNPFRIVIDVRGEATAKKTVPQTDQDSPHATSIARQLALGVNRIVIDPGHGGKDYGAPGYLKGVHEKYINLEIAKQLAEIIRQELGCEVFLTREGDQYLTLEERTAIANTKQADLFISIHANASRNQRAFGIETYFLNLTTDDESISVAARENATSKKNISELQTILNDLLQNAKINESSRLATYVQKELCSNMEKKYNRINNKGVKRAPFYVLMGAQMPAVLIETSFISNKTECERLKDKKYQAALCEGIVGGIRHYIKETQPTAYFGDPGKKGPQG